MRDHDGWNGVSLAWSWALLPIVLVAIGLVVAFAVAQGTRRDNALDVPRKRYARGEISKEEFERIEKYVE